jgi:hypothetical protein
VPLSPIRYRDLGALLRRGLVSAEDPGTTRLMARGIRARRRGWLTRGEFIAMCRWKSPRAMLHYERNSATRIRAATGRALAAPSERQRMEHLATLAGVSVPVASAILTLLDPRRYGVLDIRVWQLLFAMRSVGVNRAGRGFSIAQWERYLATLRRHARRLGATARAVEYTLFLHHRAHQRGRLYDPPGR